MVDIVVHWLSSVVFCNFFISFFSFFYCTCVCLFFIWAKQPELNLIDWLIDRQYECQRGMSVSISHQVSLTSVCSGQLTVTAGWPELNFNWVSHSLLGAGANRRPASVCSVTVNVALIDDRNTRSVTEQGAVRPASRDSARCVDPRPLCKSSISCLLTVRASSRINSSCDIISWPTWSSYPSPQCLQCYNPLIISLLQLSVTAETRLASAYHTHVPRRTHRRSLSWDT